MQLGTPVLPALTKVQVPTVPARLQASHAPPQAVLQQTPSTQLPEVHSLAAAQAVPLAFFATQAPAEQYDVETQLPSTVQLTGQLSALPVQT